MNHSMSNLEIDAYLGGTDNIVKYSELKNYETINDLLPKTNDYKIVLLEEKYNRGHYVAVIRQGTKYYYFNSYGNKYDTDLYLISKLTRCILGENHKEFLRLLAGKPMDWNKFCFQGKKSSTCGRWCCVFISFTIKMGFKPYQVIEKFKDKKIEDGYKSYDDMVLAMF